MKTKVTKNMTELTKDKKMMIRGWMELKPENLAEGNTGVEQRKKEGEMEN